MSSKRSSKEAVIKKLLKDANKAITGKIVDPETAIEHAEEVLKLDSNNYYGWLFKGTAYFLLGREDHSDGPEDQLNESYRKSIQSLIKASEINPDAVYPWKTIAEIRALDPNFVEFFSAIERCAELMAKKSSDLASQTTEEAESSENIGNQQNSYYTLSSDDINMLRFTINDYINKFDYKHNENLHVHYLHSITPHLSLLGTILGRKIQPAVQSVEALIKIYQENEKKSIKSAIQRAKTSWSINASAHDKFFREADVKWSVYKESKIIKENLWDLLVDLESMEDEKETEETGSRRWKAMARKINYLNQLLFCAPDGTRAPIKPKRPLVIGKTAAKKVEPVIKPKDEKTPIREQILDILSTLVLLRAPIQAVWDQHFEWNDPVSLFKLDIQEVANYIRLFGKDHGLGKLFHLLSISEISPWDKNSFNTLLNKSNKGNQKQKHSKKGRRNKKTASEEHLEVKEEMEADEILLSSQQIFEEMTDVINSSSTSNMLVAYRIYLALAIHVQNYQLALDYSTKYAALLADLRLKTGLQFSYSSLEHAFNLAIIYTYFESPKNFPKAEKLYTKVLTSDPDNVRAMIGMARIKMELDAYDDSKTLLENTLVKVKNQPHKIDISEVLIDYGWCCIKLGDFDAGRKTLEKAKDLVFGDSGNNIKRSSANSNVKSDEKESNVLDENGDEQTADHTEKKINKSEEDADANGNEEVPESTASLDVKTTLLYREALSYVLEVNKSDRTEQFSQETEIAYIQKAFHLFISCIKIAPTYAPAYTELGNLYESQAEQSQDEKEMKASKGKAFKCFYRAFELDPGELRSAYAVTEYFANKCDWDMVELVSSAVIDNERAKKIILKNSKAKQPNKFFGCWPYRSLGIVYMEKQDDSKAIEYFQNSLRIDQLDCPSWIALGEAYLFKGKIEAAKRVFKHVICFQADINNSEIDTVSEVELTDEMLRTGDQHAIYFLAVAESFMGQYGDSLDLLVGLLRRDDNSDMKASVLCKVCEVMVSKSGREIHSGAFKRSLSTLNETFSYFKQSFDFGRSLTAWKFYGDALLLCLNIRSHISKLPFDIINQIIDISLSDIQTSKNEDMQDIWSDIGFESAQKLQASDSEIELLDKMHYALTLCLFAALGSVAKESSKPLITSLIYNLAISFTCWYDDSKNESHRDIAIKLLKKALQIEPRNAGYWNALGLTCMDRNSRVSQHCFIKSLSIDTKSPTVWFNLGMLYLKYNDYELANQAFTRSQSIAPSSSFAWAGQAVVADANGNKQQASTLFTHSYVLSNGKNASSTLLYSANALERVFLNLADERNLENVQQITAATSAMLKYLNYYPTDIFGLEVICSIVERLHDYEKGLMLSEKLCDLLKDKYEGGDSNEQIVKSYAKVLVQRARIQLGRGDFEESLLTTVKISSLLDKLFEMNLFDEVIQRIQLSTYTASGLSKYFLGDYDGSLQELNKIVESFPDIRRVVVLISQVLYALDSEETKEAAVEELLSNMQEQGSSLLVVMTIAAMAITENWHEYMDAVKDELDMLDLKARIEDTYKEVPMLQNIINEKLGLLNSHIWQRSAFMFPQETSIWTHLNENVALDVSNASNNVDATSLAQVYIGVGGLRETQRGLWLSPGSFANHNELLSNSPTVS